MNIFFLVLFIVGSRSRFHFSTSNSHRYGQPQTRHEFIGLQFLLPYSRLEQSTPPFLHDRINTVAFNKHLKSQNSSAYVRLRAVVLKIHVVT